MPTSVLLKQAVLWGVGAQFGANLTQGALKLASKAAKKVRHKDQTKLEIVQQ